MELSVVIITKNEERNIARCLESVKWADEIIVIDDHSTDRTREIASRYGAQVYTIPWRGFGQAKREGVRRAQGDWILSIDADEEVSSELAGEIRRILSNGTPFAGFYLSRKTNFLGRWIHHSGWYPDPVLRLFQKKQGNFSEAAVHEKVLLDGNVGFLKGELLHYSYPNMEHYLEKSNRYTTLGAEAAWRNGKKSRWFDIVVRPPLAFIKHYVSKQGFRDGFEGFIISVMSAVAVFVKYAKLRQLMKKTTFEKED
ncbi:MAG: glycosyltransferase family 2 protein [Candidatus Zixiibacteriota bacterium]